GSSGSGALAAASATLFGATTLTSIASGALAAQRSVTVAGSVSASSGSGGLLSAPATLFGATPLTSGGSGALASGLAVVSGAGTAGATVSNWQTVVSWAALSGTAQGVA